MVTFIQGRCKVEGTVSTLDQIGGDGLKVEMFNGPDIIFKHVHPNILNVLNLQGIHGLAKNKQTIVDLNQNKISTNNK